MWGEKEEKRLPVTGLIISPGLREKMHQECMLEDDIRNVVVEAMGSGREMLNAATGHRIAGRCMGVITYWVEYTVNPDGDIVIYNFYSHRMRVCSDSRTGDV